ncbi:hypothetical protein ABTQ05_22310, partial [Acinetobacter baumannii]
TDHHIIEAGFLASAEARKLHALAAEQAESYAAVAKLVPLKGAAVAEEAGEDEDEAPVTLGKGEALIARPSQLLDAVL